jgi:hypothetical protein
MTTTAAHATAGATTTAGGGATAGATTAGDGVAGPSSAGSSAGAPNALAFAKCMRANGVPNFPDPLPGGDFLFDAGAVNRAAPAVQAANAKCQKFAPHPPGGPGGGSDFSSQVKAHALAQLRQVAQCMRQHGIADFPDPRTARPTDVSPGQYSEITDYQGVFLLFPATIDMQSPAWNRAAAACGALAVSFNHPHH